MLDTLRYLIYDIIRGDYMKKFQYFKGLKFTRDDKTGYYLNSTIKERMHRYVWRYYNGPIPKGYHIHHIDHDKSNNTIENLQLITIKKYTTMHSEEHVKSNYEAMCNNLIKNAVPKSKEWHKSEEGHEWHKKHYEEMKDKLYVKVTKKCKCCGKEYETYKGRNYFCSNACKSKWRRKSGIDNEKRLCEVCGKEYTVNKYSKTRTCSRSCARKICKN